MPALGPSGFSRVCPSCGRQVPRAVSTCRCGAAVPDDPGPAEVGTPSTRLTGAGLAVAAMALAGAAYWALSSPPASTSQARPDTAAAPATAAAESAPPPGGEPSPERRAWEASVANSIEPPAPLVVPPEAPTPAPAVSAPAGLEDVVGRVMSAVVLVETSTGRGSGFFVRPDTVLTNVHVVEGDGFVTLRRMDGSSVQARVESRSPAFDIAVLKVSSPAVNQTVIPLGSVKTLRPGQEVIIIGSALGTLQNSVTRGIVSGVRESRGALLVQTDAAANPGNSGGPLLDRTGTAIGITTLGYRDRQGLNFAVAIDHARDILEGRQVPSRAGSLTLNDLRTPSAGVESEADRAQEDGARAFMAAMETLARGADELDRGWKRFRDSCYSGPMAGSFDREWFAVFSPRALPSPVPQECGAYLSSFTAEAERFRGAMRTALDNARRSGVLPGVGREALRSRRLQFDGWDR